MTDQNQVTEWYNEILRRDGREKADAWLRQYQQQQLMQQVLQLLQNQQKQGMSDVEVQRQMMNSMQSLAWHLQNSQNQQTQQMQNVLNQVLKHMDAQSEGQQESGQGAQSGEQGAPQPQSQASGQQESHQDIQPLFKELENQIEGHLQQQEQWNDNQAKRDERLHTDMNRRATKERKLEGNTNKSLKAALGGAGNAVSGLGGGMGKSNKENTFWLLLLSLLIFLSDIFITGFNGLDYETFLNFITLNPVDFIWKYVFSAVTLVIVTSYVVIRRPPAQEAISFGVLTVILITIFSLFGYTAGGIVHLLFIILIYLQLVRQRSDLVTGHYMLAGFILLDFFLVSALTDIVGFNLRFIPVWFIAVVAMSQGDWDPGSKFLTIAFITFYLFGMLSSYASPDLMNMADTLDPQAEEEFISFANESFSNMGEFATNVYNGLMGKANSTLGPHRQDYYSGRVDRNAEVELGVEVDSIEFSSEDFFMEEPVSLWSTLTVNTLEDKAINVSTSCVAEKDGATIQPESLRPEQFVAYETDKRPIDCVFSKYTFEKGDYTAKISTEFDFLTRAYQKAYFMDREKVMSLEMEEENPLEHYGIEEEDPDTIHTNGPVEIGMKLRNNPMRVDTSRSSDMHIMFGVTIRNAWDGALTLRNFNITLPPGMQPSLTADDEFRCSGHNFSCHESAGGAVCRLTGNLQGDNIEEYKTFRCPLEIPDEDKKQVLGDSPVSIMYFRAAASYNYTITQAAAFEIKEGEYINNLKEKTKASSPNLTVPPLSLQPATSAQIDLREHSDDRETETALLEYEIVDEPRDTVMDCSLRDGRYLNCTALDKDRTRITLSVSDLAQEKKQDIVLLGGNESCGWEGLPECSEGTFTEESDEDNDAGGDGENTSGPPQLKKPLPTNTVNNDGWVPFYGRGYIEDPDGSGGLTYDFPTGDDKLALKDAECRDGDHKCEFRLKNEDIGCDVGYTYTFTVADGDGNEKDFNLTFNLLCKECRNDCDKCKVDDTLSKTLCRESGACDEDYCEGTDRDFDLMI